MTQSIYRGREFDSTDYTRTCSIWRAMDVVGDVPTLLIVGSALLGGRRFDDFRRLTHLQQATLSARLKHLVTTGCLKRVATDGGLRHEYRLTRTGVDLQGIALMLLSWETQWDTTARALHRIKLIHRDCGEPTVAEAHCATCRQDVRASDVRWEDGPGAGFILAAYRRRRRQASSVRAKQALTVFPDRVNNIIGDRWSVLILRAIFSGCRRYDDIHRETRAATNILADRIRMMIEDDLLYHSDAGDYGLTPRGLDTLPILALLMAWGDRWRAAPEGPPMILRHIPCGQPLAISLDCSHCSAPMTAGNVAFEIETPSVVESSIPA